jgi:hypothetical protein
MQHSLSIPFLPGNMSATSPRLFEHNGAPVVEGTMNKEPKATQNQFEQTRAQVEEVAGIMRLNVMKVLERDQKLSELNDRANALEIGASQFAQQSTKIKSKYCWKNTKSLMVIGVIGLVLVAIAVISVARGGSGSGQIQ